jgi:uncharacterized protein
MAEYILFGALYSGFQTLMEYLSAHVLTCLIPAFFIAGAISALLKKETVLKYFGADSPKWLCYSVAATSGTILAVCSCTILPMFAGIEKRGAGIGPATTFLFSGPAINLMAIILTARVLGLDIGLARAVAAISMSIIIGLIMAAIFERANEKCKATLNPSVQVDPELGEKNRPGYITGIFMAVLVAILLVATTTLIAVTPKAAIIGGLVLIAAHLMRSYYLPEEREAFLGETWWLFKRIFPLLVVGTFITGVIGYFLPMDLIGTLFGTSSFLACFIASIVGALLYMPTLLEVPIVGTLFGYSTGVTAPGPALSLLLAGPSLSLPSMIVIWQVIGARKASVYISLVVLISTFVGVIYGAIVS